MSERLAETGSPKIVRASILSICFVLCVLLFWAQYTDIDEVATATGEIVPLEQIIPVQHVEGGIVYKVYVKDGVSVEKGQPLFELNPEPNTSDLNRLKKRENSLEVAIFRLQSQLNGKAITYEDMLNALTYKDITESGLMNLEISNALMYQQQQLQQVAYNKAQLATRLAEERLNLKNNNDQLLALEERKKVIESQHQMYTTLTEQKAISKVDLLNVQERLQEVIGSILTIRQNRTTIETTILELENKLKTFEFDKNNAALKELNDDTSQLLEVREQISRAQVAVDQLKVKAEAAGIVKGFALHPGDVVTAGTVLFNIVPIDSKLIAEVKVTTTDVGHIKVGDPVQIKVGTYDFATYGALEGTLTSISASTFLDPDKKPYYKCDVSLPKNYLGDDPTRNLIFPGMTVIAEIKTGKRSLLHYMLKPINRTFTEAFRER
ncbi:MAG TPA: HlyD family type I secretion periplasmic adaptor subunit [Gammaproteobacteria bacterium]|nr:HlyD family type I secretion periplasmic adaptor subunit [Gammaproteobacteria bacterium]